MFSLRSRKNTATQFQAATRAAFSMPDADEAPSTERRCVHRDSNGVRCITPLREGNPGPTCHAHEDDEPPFPEGPEAYAELMEAA